ncbi:YibE/F family protein [Nocardioides sp. KR10-350]|uniref:YibE/F family protein n=1 Tax=Nocardioides cheoyonin TaxID=3156615 RepID=UPI0032B4B0ED
MAGYQGRRRADRSVGHGHSHGHSHGPAPDLPINRGTRATVVALLVVLGLAVVGGLVALWPDHDRVERLAHSLEFAAPGTTFPHATVVRVGDCPSDPISTCPLVVKVDDGPRVTVQVSQADAASGLGSGDRVQLQHRAGASGSAAYSYFRTDRGTALWLLVGLFVLVVVAVARLRGLLALVGLGVGMVVILGWMLPGLLSGHPPLLVALVGSAAILYVVLYLAHGVSLRTSAALLGTVGGLAVTALLGLASVGTAHLSGVADEGGTMLSSVTGRIDFQGLMTCTIVIAGLGVLNDVTITQASAVWELRAASPTASRARLWASAMRIGRDHIASTIYTIVFAYAGTALTTLLVVELYDRPLLDLLGTEQIAEEVVRSLVSGIGLVLAVPLTTAVAALTVPGPSHDVA